MALSGTYNFTVVLTDIINESMLNIGAIGPGETPTAQESSDCQRKLNMMVKQWMGTQDFAPGLKMWTRQRADLFLSSTKGIYQLGPTGDNWAAGVAAVSGVNYVRSTLTVAAAQNATTLTVGTTAIASYTANDFVVVQLASGDIYSTTVSSINSGAGTFTIPATGLSGAANSGAYVWNYTTKGQRPLSIRTCILRDANLNDIPLSPMTLEEYEALPSKQMPGFLSDPQRYYYESQFASGTSNSGPGMLYLDIYGAQDVTKSLHVVYMRPVMDLNNPTDNPEYPQQWYRALCWGLSREICAMFDAEWTTDMDLNYREALAMAREADSETTALYFAPNAEQSAYG